MAASPPAEGAVFPLYADEAAAAAAGYRERIKLLTRFEGSVRGLAIGAPVELYGIQIGNVTDIKLDFDPSGASSRVTVRFEVQPERMSQIGASRLNETDSLAVARRGGGLSPRRGLARVPRRAGLASRRLGAARRWRV